jgi:sugar lactone lactonase YvrE
MMCNTMKQSLLNLPAIALVSGLSALGILAPAAQAALLVGNTRGNNVAIFDERTGNYGGEFITAGSGGLTDPDDLTFGPDGNLYVSSGTSTSGAILKFDGKTGSFLGRFDQGGSLLRPYGSVFGPDNKLYVSSFRSDQILRYDALTGAFLDVFAAGTGTINGLNGPNDLLFGPDGNLYVSTQGSVADGKGAIDFRFDSQILKYDIATGTSSAFVSQATPLPDSFNFVSFLGLALGPQGELVTSDFANGIRSYDFTTGALLRTLPTNFTGTNPSNNFTGSITFDPNNLLYTVGFDTSQNNQGAILRFDGLTGANLPAAGQSGAVFVAQSAVLNRPVGIAYSPLTVPEPGVVIGLLALGLLGISQMKSDRSDRQS